MTTRSAVILFAFNLLPALVLGQCIVGNAVAPNTESGNNTVGQSFTATCSGTIEYVEFFCASSGTNTGGTLNIFSGSTVLGTPIHTQTYAPMTLTAGDAIRIYLDAPVNVMNGNQRTFEMQTSLDVAYSGSNPYPGGRFFYNGTNSTVYAQIDMKFNVSILSNCTNTTANVTADACGAYTAPSGTQWTSTGIYTDTIPNMAGCDSIITVDLTVNVVDTSVSQNGMDLFANAINATYQWLDCDDGFAPVPGADQQSFTPAGNGNFAVLVTDSLCSDTSSCYTVLGTGIEAMRAEADQLFPNPTTGMLRIAGNGPCTRAEITDLSGKHMATLPCIGRTLDLSFLKNGTYLIQLYNGDRSAVPVRMVLLR